MHFKKMLVTTDFSDAASAAYELAAYQAKFEGTEITLLNVVTDWVVPVSMYEYIPQPERIEDYRRAVIEKSRTELEKIAKKSFHGQKVLCEALPTEAPPHRAICDYATKKQFDLIVISSHGHGAIGALVLGSTVQRVVQHAPCPVLVMPYRKR